jgi:hypothetical protein
MPIKNVSDIRRITRGGYLRLGRKVESQRKRGVMYPEKSDHFIADFEDKRLEQVFHDLYGNEPKRITVSFASDDPDVIFPQWFKCYGASTGLKCKGDGAQAQRIIDGDMHEVECPGPAECDFSLENGSGGKPGCKRIGSLQFFIRGLPGIQVFQINTTSFNSIVNLNTGIDLLRTLRRGRGIFGVWVDLLLVPQDAQAGGKKVNIFVLKLDIPVDLDQALSLTSVLEGPIALPPPGEDRDEYLYGQLPAPVAEKPEPEPETEPETAATIIEPQTWTADTLAAHPDVTATLRTAGYNRGRARALFDRAVREGWGPDDIVEYVREQMGADEGEEPEPEPDPAPARPAAPRPAAPRPAAATRPVAATDIDF